MDRPTLSEGPSFRKPVGFNALVEDRDDTLLRRRAVLPPSGIPDPVDPNTVLLPIPTPVYMQAAALEAKRVSRSRVGGA